MKKFRRIIAATMATLTFAGISLSAGAAQVSDFKDVKPGAWYYSAVEYAAREGLFSGTSKTTFSPEQAMTRGMFVTVLGKQAKAEGSANRNSFSDVKSSDYFAPYVEWAAGNGIVSGTGNGKFSPNQSVTREQMAVILYNYVGKIGGNTSYSDNAVNRFPDSRKVSGFAEKAMQWAVSHRILSGSDGKLLPQGTATRAQVAQVFMNARDLLAGEQNGDEPNGNDPSELPQLILHSHSWAEDQNPYEILEQVLAGTDAKWNPNLNRNNAYREIVIDFVDWGDSHQTADWAIFNTLELLNDTGADSFYILEEYANGVPSEMLTLYYTIPEKADSALMVEIKKLVQKEFPNATFKIMGGGHGWQGFMEADSDLTLAQNAQRVAATEIRYLKEWYSPSDTFTYWVSEPKPGIFYFFY